LETTAVSAAFVSAALVAGGGVVVDGDPQLETTRTMVVKTKTRIPGVLPILFIVFLRKKYDGTIIIVAISGDIFHPPYSQ
jgi:hypothetical protein